MRTLALASLLCCFLITIEDDLRRAFVARLRRAIELAGLNDQQAADCMGLTASRWSDQCAGRENISFTRIMKLPVDVHRWHALLLARDLGYPAEIESAVRTKRMLRMPLRDGRQKEIA